MSHKRFLIGCLCAAWIACPVLAADVDIDDLQPGLIATYRDAAQPPTELARIDPTVAAFCKPGESPHPRLAADGSVEWQGYLNILRAGNHRFSARVRGKVHVTVAGKDVLAVEGKSETPELLQGPEGRLESGPQPLTIKFTRLDGAARLELLWQSPAFRLEPLPHDALYHLPAKAPPRLAADRTLERGRFLAEEFSCVQCHRADAGDKMAKGLQSRQGPDLSQVGGRVHAGWLLHWLDDPQKVRPGSAMPRVFANDENGKVEIYAVSRYLASLTGPAKPAPKPPNPKDMQVSVAAGQRLFSSVGCVVCHPSEPPKNAPPPSLYGDPRHYPLTGLGSKMTAESLAAYLANPLAVDPSGRMPDMLLDAKEALDLARFLSDTKHEAIAPDLPAAPADTTLQAAYQRLKPTDDEKTVFANLKPDSKWLALGQRLVIERGCNNCHTIAPGGKALPSQAAKSSFDALKAAKAPTTGCLADEATKRGAAPGFTLSDADRKALRSFLSEGSKGAGSPAPTHAGRVVLHRFNCFACHSRNGKGGLTPEIVEDLRRYEKAENAEAVMPPPLTGVGHKLRTAWIKQILTQKGRARPWMGLRMPQFGPAHVGQLAETLAYLEGVEPDDKVHQTALSAAVIDAGKHLVGKNAFGCIACHDLAGIPNTGTRGPDLAYMNQRVRYDWYLLWLEQAQRMQPGTRMPTVFPDGKTTLDKVLDGTANAQAEAMWAYLSLGPSLPLPAGIELTATKGRILNVTDQPVTLRCFMPDTGSRAIAVGYPNGVSVSFDANTCRLGYAWSGNFLDVAPIWNDRAGTPVKLLGPRFWTAPSGAPWALSDSQEPPDFIAQAKDPAYGAPLPDNKVFQGVKQVRFLGYNLDAAGVPTFRYVVAAGEKESLTVAERLESLRNSVAVGVRRRFTLTVPAQHSPWLLVGETTGELKQLNAQGDPIALDLKIARTEVTNTERPLLLMQGDKAVVLSLAAAPKGTTWLLQKQGTAWQVMLRLPAPTKVEEAHLTLNVWSPYRAEAALLKELASAK